MMSNLMNNITVNSNTAPSPKPKSSDSRHWHCYLVVEPKLHHQEHLILNIKYDLFSSFYATHEAWTLDPACGKSF